MRWVWIILILTLAGCAETTGVNKELPMNLNQEGSGNNITMNINLDLDSDTLGESGDPRISPQTSASVYGPSQASGADALMDDLKYVIEKWMDNRKTDSENTTTQQAPAQPPLPDGGMDIGDLEVIEPDLDDYDAVARAECDKEMYYTHSGESSGTKQKRCVFDKPGTEYGSSFLVQWSSGNTLTVPDSSNMAWDTTDFRKYQPVDPEDDSGNAGVYAGRGDNSSYAQILVKKE